MERLVFGCGYLGARVAKYWLAAGDAVHVVTRSEDSAVAYAEAGYQTMVADVTCRSTLQNLPTADTVLFAVGYDRSSDKSIEQVYGEGVCNVLAALPESVKRLIYISTTGVYGDAAGDWIDENRPPDAQRAGGRASLLAEQAIAEHSLGERAVALRLAGIYGPGRIPYLNQLRAGEPIAAPSEGWLNLIHVDDAARIVVEADCWLAEHEVLQARDRLAIFNVSDGSPVVRGDYYKEVAQRISAAPPRFSAPEANSPAARRAAADKRVSNRKLVETLGYEFLYPSYREGLAAILP